MKKPHIPTGFRFLIFAALCAAFACIEAAETKALAPIRISADDMRAVSGTPGKREVKIKSRPVSAWVFSGKDGGAVSAVSAKMPEGYRGVKIEIAAAPLEKPKGKSDEDVYRAVLSQTDPETGKEVNKLKCVPARSKISTWPFREKTVELESCYPALPGLPVNVRIERLAGDPSEHL